MRKTKPNRKSEQTSVEVVSCNDFKYRNIEDIIESIDPDMGGFKLKKFFDSWSRSLKRTELDLANSLHFLQMIHAVAGFGSNELTKWIETQTRLIESQSRHLERWHSTRATDAIESKFEELRADFDNLLAAIKKRTSDELYNEIMEEWRGNGFQTKKDTESTD
jgi:hypothetical protein